MNRERPGVLFSYRSRRKTVRLTNKRDISEKKGEAEESIANVGNSNF